MRIGYFKISNTFAPLTKNTQNIDCSAFQRNITVIENYMKYCPKCHTQLVQDAKFCHNCGAKVEIALIGCSHCGKKNPADAVACYSCALPLGTFDLLNQEQPFLGLSFHREDLLEDELRELFLNILSQNVNFIASDKYAAILERFYYSNFNRTVDLRARQLADEFATKYRQSPPPSVPQLVAMEKEIETAVEGLVMMHIIRNCRDLTPVPLPDSILRHERTHRGNVRVPELIFNYLDLQNERKRWYSDFSRMSEDKFRNASICFLHAAMDEQVYFIYDDSLLGNCKEGFAMTEFGLYWKAPFNKPRRLYYHNIDQVARQKDHLNINGFFFHINASMDLKMFLLLRKLWRIYGT